jgi:hypothetical protein
MLPRFWVCLTMIINVKQTKQILSSGSFALSNRSLSSYISAVAKKAFLGFRLMPELKVELEKIASREERSISQICEIFLRMGVDAYRRQGPKHLQGFLSRRRESSN